ncbi:MAG: P-II family nitrogen regulator [Desulfovibrionaceae bacterium]|nr:P-II family nitrogen regulator [Desulfovibrionaceae bacterium]
MKKVEIILRPGMLEVLRDALAKLDLHGMNYTDIRGYGRQHGHTEVYRGAIYQIDFLPKVKIEIVLDDEQVESVINTVVSTVRTGKVGDGKIFVSEVVDAIRIRTGERGSQAI